MRPSAILKGTSEEHKKQKKDGGRHSNAEKNLPKVESTVSFWMHSEWSGLRFLANFRFVIIVLVFKKITFRN